MLVKLPTKGTESNKFYTLGLKVMERKEDKSTQFENLSGLRVKSEYRSTILPMDFIDFIIITQL